MSYSAKILLDSISTKGIRLTTMEVTYPRFVHSEMMTHRVFSRNAASSRAIPTAKMLERVDKDPVVPVWWGKNQSGMQAQEELEARDKSLALAVWLGAKSQVLDISRKLTDLNVHKQIVNRLLEPFSWITVIITATEWSNFFSLRCHPDAQPEIKHIAEQMYNEYSASTPTVLEYGQWHCPLIQKGEVDEALQRAYAVYAVDPLAYANYLLRQVSVARCARISYLTHDGKRDIDKDIELYERLLTGGGNGHWSPFEHVATPIQDLNDAEHFDRDGNFWSGNFRGWKQFRKEFPQENVRAYGSSQ